MLGQHINENNVYGIVGKKTKYLKKFIMLLLDCFGDNVEYEFTYSGKGEYLVQLQVDISKLVHDIGFILEVSFEEEILDMVLQRKMCFDGLKGEKNEKSEYTNPHV